MQSCETCSLFESAGLLETWKMGYCRARYETCARYQLSLQGRPVPLDLLPNGVNLKHRGAEGAEGP